MKYERWLRYGLLLLILVLGYDLILGKGGLLRLKDLDRQMEVQKNTNLTLEQRNAALSAEVKDLRSGSGALEERARVDLGMVRPGETWYRYVAPPPVAPVHEPSAPPR